ncbi:hypothetical protein TFLX_00138 [Thermoflexales bacterium]|nr:hypothetical protein TFLX_00138 [Thermoflexales bacterium]
MFGQLHEIANHTLFVEGLEPSLILKEPDVASAVLHKSGDTLYVMDTGATPVFRARMIEAAERLRPFDRLVLLNSHAHPDHTPNNSVLHEIPALTKEHYISAVGIPFLDYAARTKADFAGIGEYYHLEDGPGLPFGLITRLFKPFRWIYPDLIDRHFVNFMVSRVMSKFRPLEPSLETATPFEHTPAGPLPIQGLALTGWNLRDDVYVIESRGHTQDSVSFYLPKVKVLFLSDETVTWFNCWADSSAARVIRILEATLAMYHAGMVDVLIGGHQQDQFRGAAIPALIHRLIDNHQTLVNTLELILAEHPTGLTVPQIYRKLSKFRSQPAIDGFFREEFPKMPGMLKTAITYALLEAGFTAEGAPGKKRFRRLGIY